ncbi:transcription factor A, mitochondrial [Episyrphus balteatus]|uniref:transcription factor A, mitochondrial n=1 Tax=Episyrphus balteatus TaxID=286459 RepID=UPI002485902A|nr:transcription factor A, mitochondrial [Episyrphus balteatus]
MISLTCALRATNNFSRIFTNSIRPGGVIQCQPAAGLKNLEEKVGLPPKPKKPLTPFFRYIKQVRPTILAENPHFKATDVIKTISKQWETVDPALKLKFQEEYQREKTIYVETRAKYDSQITDEQRYEMKQLKDESNIAKERRMTKKRIAQLERPKKPASAFLLFVSKERQETPQGPNQTYRQWHATITQKWAKLSDSEKEPFLQMFRDKLVKYKEDIAVWEEKMVSLGNMDVVRPEILVDPPTPRSKSRK